MKICELCGKSTNTLYHTTEQFVLSLIEYDHPEWIQKDGSCERCIEYYEYLDDAIKVEADLSLTELMDRP